jgi:hypothetical protein
MEIKLDVRDGSFDVESNVKKERRADLLENVVRAQIGAGEDNRKPVVRDIYTIKIFYDMDDTFSIKSDTGNDGLTTGILADVLGRI